MIDQNETRLNLLRSIKSLSDANRLSPDNRISRIIDTSQILHNGYEMSPARIDLIPKRTFRIFIPILIGLIIVSLTFKAILTGIEERAFLFVGISFLLLLFVLVIRHFWFNPDFETKLTIDFTGINYNGTLYKWPDILTTHLEEITYSIEGYDPELYLILGLTSGELKTLNISNLTFKNAFWRSLKPRKLGGYIEHCKNNSH
jgi:hypothetical protein